MVTRLVYAPAHLRALALQPAQAWFSDMLRDDSYAESLAESKWAYTLMLDGRIIGCLGVLEIWPGRGMAWALLADEIGAAMIAVHRIVHRFLWSECPLTRVEAYVDARFEAGHRWVHRLGFEREGLMRQFGQHGGDMVMWSRIR